MRILVVEDDPYVRRALMATLLRGHEVHAAADYESALDYLDGSRVFDAVILDGSLPGATDEEMLREVRRLQPGAVAVAYTGMYVADDHGYDAVVLKPASTARLVRAIEAAIADKRRSS